MTVEDDLLASTINLMRGRKRWPPYKRGWDKEGSQSFIYAKYPLAWVAAQFLHSLTRGRHHPGQNAIRIKRNQLLEKSPEDQKKVAAQWNNQLEQDSDLVPKIEKCLRQEPNDTLEDDDATANSPTSATSPSPLTTGALLQTLHDQAQAPITLDTPDNNPSDQILVGASLRSAKRLLPSDLYDAIYREPHHTMRNKYLAAITMQFSSAFNNDECKMTIRIRADTVAYFAFKWFNVRIESRQGLRYIRFPNSPTVVTGASDMVLSGCRRDLLTTEFGSDVSKAIMQSPTCLQDEHEVALGTNSVWLKVSNNANEVGEVVLSLGFLLGTDIRMALYAS